MYRLLKGNRVQLKVISLFSCFYIYLLNPIKLLIFFRNVVSAMHPPGQPIVVFRPDVALSNERDETFNGSLLSYDEVSVWMAEKCVPLVREITFENAEELTEEGLPFLILFHKPGDDDTVKRYKDVCAHQLISEKRMYSLINFIPLFSLLEIFSRITNFLYTLKLIFEFTNLSICFPKF